MPTSSWEAILERLDDAAKLVDVDPDIHRILRVPERILEVSVPVRMDDGSVEVFVGWRIHHDTTRGPGKGRLAIAVLNVIDAASALTSSASTSGWKRMPPFPGPRVVSW